MKEQTPIMIDAEWAREHIPRRPEHANKGSFGRTLLLVGSPRYKGAAHLALEAALRSGVGYVSFYGGDSLSRELRMHFPELIFARGSIAEASSVSGATLFGSGSGSSVESLSLIRELLSAGTSPLVLDADALNTVAGLSSPDIFLSAGRPLVLTPHPLEFSRISGLSLDEIQRDRVGTAVAFAQSYGVILLLKGKGTVVTDGTVALINTSGSTALAKAGSGDVLAGLTAGLLAYSEDPLSAVALAAYLHGRAGDSLALTLSEYGVTPSDLPRAIACEINRLTRKSSP